MKKEDEKDIGQMIFSFKLLKNRVKFYFKQKSKKLLTMYW